MPELNVHILFVIGAILMLFGHIESNLKLRPTKSLTDVLNLGRQERLMSVTIGRITRKPFMAMGRQLPAAYGNSRFKSQQQYPYMQHPRSVYKGNQGIPYNSPGERDQYTTVSTTIRKGGMDPAQPNNEDTTQPGYNHTEKLVTIRYTGPSTPSTHVMYARGQSPAVGLTLFNHCKNADCMEVLWGEVTEHYRRKINDTV